MVGEMDASVAVARVAGWCVPACMLLRITPPIVSRQHRVPVLLLVVVMPHQRRQAEASEEKDSTAGRLIRCRCRLARFSFTSFNDD